MTEILPYGAWKSPITSDLIVAETIGLGAVLIDGGDIYWTESRPGEGGRNVLVKRNGGDVTPPPFNVRTRLHEYGGGAGGGWGGGGLFSTPRGGCPRAKSVSPGSSGTTRTCRGPAPNYGSPN